VCWVEAVGSGSGAQVLCVFRAEESRDWARASCVNTAGHSRLFQSLCVRSFELYSGVSAVREYCWPHQAVSVTLRAVVWAPGLDSS
jgi:hypothetical protein